MLNLAGLTPVGVRYTPHGPRLQWRTNGETIETGFDRFRPVRVVAEPEIGVTRLIWRDFNDLPMTDPFFNGAQNIALGRTDWAAAFQTDLDVAHRIASQPGSLPFSGAIFHMARTGSTLVHRLLSKSGKVMSLSEVPIIYNALSQVMRLPEEQRGAVLRGVVAAYGRARRPSEQHLVLKMQDVFSNKQLPVFRAAFPQTKWIFIYRDPVEVMASLLRTPSGTMGQWFRNRVVTARRLGMPAIADGGMWPAEFLARTLRRGCESAIAAAETTPAGGFLAVSYRRLPDAVWETIGPHFGIDFNEREREAMREAARYSAKNTNGQEFTPDSEKKKQEAAAHVHVLAERMVMPMIRKLESLPQG
jgi:hypothetical protein